MMRSLLIRTLLVLALAGLAAPVALADDPPVTVPTPTVPAPDPAPPPQSSKPPAKSPPKQHSAPPPHRSTPGPSSQSTFTPPATTRRVAPVRRVTPKARVRHTKRVVKHKVKAAQKTVKPAVTPRKRPTASPSRLQRREATRAGVPTAGSDWLKWTLILGLATGLMAASVLGLIGTARSPVGARTRRRRPPIRDVVAEPVGVAFPPAATPIPPRTPAPPTVVAPTPLPEPPSAPVAPEVRAPAPSPPAAEPAIPAAAIAAALAGAVPVEPIVAPEPEPTEEFCEIRVWRGYAKARFYASLDLAAEDEFAVAESPSFRFRGNGMPDDTEAAHEAHQALVQKLVAKGWEPEGSSGAWFSTRFRRPLETSNAPF